VRRCIWGVGGNRLFVAGADGIRCTADRRFPDRRPALTSKGGFMISVLIRGDRPQLHGIVLRFIGPRSQRVTEVRPPTSRYQHAGRIDALIMPAGHRRQTISYRKLRLGPRECARARRSLTLSSTPDASSRALLTQGRPPHRPGEAAAPRLAHGPRCLERLGCHEVNAIQARARRPRPAHSWSRAKAYVAKIPVPELLGVAASRSSAPCPAKPAERTTFAA